VETTNFTIVYDKLTINSPAIVDTDTVKVYYKIPPTSQQARFLYCNNPANITLFADYIFGTGSPEAAAFVLNGNKISVPPAPEQKLLRLLVNTQSPIIESSVVNISPAPTQRRIAIRRLRKLVNGSITSTTINRTRYKIIEDRYEYLPDQFTPNTIVYVDDAQAFNYTDDAIEVLIDSGNFTQGTSTTALDIFTADSRPQRRYDLGVLFNPLISNPTVSINNRLANTTNKFSSKKIVVASQTVNISDMFGVSLSPLGVGTNQITVFYNGQLLARTQFTITLTLLTQEIVIDDSLSGGVDIAIGDVVDVMIAPVCWFESKIKNNVETLDIVFDSDSRISITPRPIAVTYGKKQLSGAYKNDDGRISHTNVLQDGYKYQEFSYIIHSSHSLNEYSDYVKNLLHPSGMIMFGEITLDQCIAWIIDEYKYYVKLADMKVFPSVNNVPVLGANWHSFEINKFDYGLTKVGGLNTNIESMANQIISEVIDNPYHGIDLLMDSGICINEAPPEPPIEGLFPPFIIGVGS
jgi:hypothetical protein